MKLLVVTSEPVGPDDVRAALGDDREGDVEVRVIAPALNQSPLAFWVSDPDNAIAEADAVRRESVGELRREGVEASGATGESDPVQALQDALALFPADRVLVFVAREGEREHREVSWIDKARERFDVPIDTHALDAS